MRKLKKFLLMSLLLVSFTFIGCSKIKDKEDIVVAEAENIKIYLKDFLYFFNNARESQDYYLENTLGFKNKEKLNYWKTKNGETTFEDMLKENILNILKYQSTALFLAKEKNIKLTSKEIKEVNKQVENFVMSLNSAEKRGEKVLFEKYKIKPEDLKNIQKNILTIDKYTKELKNEINSNSDMKITEDEILKFYDENTEFVEKNIDMKVTVRHILIKCDPSMNEKEQEAKKELAESLLKRVQEGEDIGKLAKEYSEDEGSANKNGEYTFGRQEMVEEFEDWAFSKNIGDTGIVKTQYGYHVMKLISKPSFEDMYEKIKEFIISHLNEEEAFKTIENLIKEKNLNWKINEEIYNNIKIEYSNNEENSSQDNIKENSIKEENNNTEENIITEENK